MTLTENAIIRSRLGARRANAQAAALRHTDHYEGARDRANDATALHGRVLERHHRQQARRILNAPPWAPVHMAD